MDKIAKIQDDLENSIKQWYKSLDEKKRKTILFIPKIFVFMLFCIYFSGFIYNREDFIVSIVSCILIALIILFLPLSKILD